MNNKVSYFLKNNLGSERVDKDSPKNLRKNLVIFQPNLYIYMTTKLAGGISKGQKD